MKPLQSEAPSLPCSAVTPPPSPQGEKDLALNAVAEGVGVAARSNLAVSHFTGANRCVEMGGGGVTHLAVDAVTGGGGDGADEIGWVDVFDVGVLEVALDLITQPNAGVQQDGVAAQVPLLLPCGLQEVLYKSSTLQCLLQQ